MSRSNTNCEVIPAAFPKLKNDRPLDAGVVIQLMLEDEPEEIFCWKTGILRLCKEHGYHMVNMDLACKIGLRTAHVLHQIHELCMLYGKKYPKLDLGRNQWIQLTFNDMALEIPYISRSTIHKKIIELKDLGLLFSRKSDGKRGSFYRVNYIHVEEILGR